MDSSTRSDEGSVLLLGLGLFVVALLVLTTAVNVATLWQAQRILRTNAQGAALAAAQGVDTAAVYRGELGPLAPLDLDHARKLALKYLAALPADKRVVGVHLQRLTIRQDKVAVQLTGTGRIPFGYLAPSSSVPLRAMARAEQIVQ